MILKSFDDLKKATAPGIAAALSSLPKADPDASISSYAVAVIDCFPKGSFDLFDEIIHNPERYRYLNDRFWMVLRVGRDAEWGAILREKLDA